MSKQKKYHYIYKTTCKITGKFYVGMHSTDNLEDGYLGSGKILGYSRHKYGDENHIREILEYLPSRDKLKEREKEIVNEELLAQPLNINLKYGGEGGWDHIVNSAGYKRQLQKAGKNGGFANKSKWSAETKIKVSKLLSNARTNYLISAWQGDNRAVMLDNLQKIRMLAASKKVAEKRKNTFADRNHMQGEKNSQYGTCWVIKDIKPIKIKKEHLEEYLAVGYSRGRINKC